MSHLHHSTIKTIDLEKWGDPFNPEDAGNPTKCNSKIVTGYVLCQIELFEVSYQIDYQLQEEARESFEGWTTDILDLATPNSLRKLKTYLLQHGVYVQNSSGGKKNTELLIEAIFNDYHEWTAQEIEEYLNKGVPTDKNKKPVFFSRCQERLLRRKEKQQEPSFQPTQDSQQDSQIQNILQNPQNPQQNSPQHPPIQPFYYPQPPIQPIYSPQVDPLIQTRRALTDLNKLYSEEIKFEDIQYDIFDSKLKIFQDNCAKVGIAPESYSIAFSTMLKGKALELYYNKISGKRMEFGQMTSIIRDHFHTQESRQAYLNEWIRTTFSKVIAENSAKTRLKALNLLFEKLEKIQKGLPLEYQTDGVLRDQIINACRDVEECELALFSPAQTYEALRSQLQSAVATRMASQEAKQQSQFLQQHPKDDNEEEMEQYWVDRTFRGRGGTKGRGNFRSGKGPGFGSNSRNNSGNGFGSNSRNNSGNRTPSRSYQKKCYVCGKPGCWSTKHTPDERRESFNKFRQRAQYTLSSEPTKDKYAQFLAKYEGIDGLDDPQDDDVQQMLLDLQIDDESFFTSEAYPNIQIDSSRTIAFLADQATFHAVTGIDVFNVLPKSEVYTFEDRYSEKIFQGIMPDTGAAGVSTAGQKQFNALAKINPSITLNQTTAGQHKIRFGKGEAINLGSTIIPTELRQLHRRFGYPSVRRLYEVLSKSGHEVELKMIEYLTKYCHQCQMNSKAPGRFKFSLKKDCEFNFEIIIDVIYIDNKPILHWICRRLSYTFLSTVPLRTTRISAARSAIRLFLRMRQRNRISLPSEAISSIGALPSQKESPEAS